MAVSWEYLLKVLLNAYGVHVIYHHHQFLSCLPDFHRNTFASKDIHSRLDLDRLSPIEIQLKVTEVVDYKLVQLVSLICVTLVEKSLTVLVIEVLPDHL